VNLAILGVNPSDRLEGALPSGSRSAQFSRSPDLGEPSTGKGESGAAVHLPGVKVKEAPSGITPAPPPTTPPPDSRVVLEIVAPRYASTIAAPLRPFARSLPRQVEARFGRRVVYTMVIPRPNLAFYAGDWILWFAELEERPNETARMRPPLPARKFEPIGADTNVDLESSREIRLQFSAVIRKDGKISGVEVIAKVPPSVGKALAEDLSRWEFRPATNNGTPIDVEAVIEIPFQNSASRESLTGASQPD
jgi:hypothetical protein